VQAHLRKLTPLQEDTVRALTEGVRCHGLAGVQCIHAQLASRYGVSKRTILRTIDRSPIKVEVVVLGGYYAQFEIHELGPVQRTDWRAVA
jgi:hypothetical protein